ncbi:hypothetical protein D3C76_1753920 [compost metagenome]
MAAPAVNIEMPSHWSRKGINGMLTSPAAVTLRPTITELSKAQLTTRPMTISIRL